MTPWNRLKDTVLTTEQVRCVDQLAIAEFGMHSLVLMENAALGCVEWIRQKFERPRQTVILSGRGNNGGDGLVIARHLRLLGWPCQAYVLGPESQLSADNRANLRILQVDEPNQETVVDPEISQVLSCIRGAELIVDAMLGTGATGDPRSPFSDWIVAANLSAAYRLAIDIPTGVCAETGELGTPCFQADATLTFVAKKPAMVQPTANSTFGDLEVLPIGVPNGLIRRILRDAGLAEGT